MKWLAALLLGLPAALAAQDVHTFIPARAYQYLPVLTAQVQELTPRMPTPHYFAALIELESCISLTHSRCWSPTSRLKSDREEGAGLGQLTRAYRPDGSIRFDALQESRRLDPRGLDALRWETVYQRPDLQLRVVVLMTRANDNRLAPLIPDAGLRLPFVDAAYNGGLGGVMNERRACQASPGCNPNDWFLHVHKHCLKSPKPLYAGRSACDINRHHVDEVIRTRMPKYAGKV